MQKVITPLSPIMGKVQTENNADFPMLASAGLCITDITGDGNCLFRALADQIHGTQSKYSDIRARVIVYLRENPDDFKPFIAVGPEPTRQNPKRNAKATKRKMAGAIPASVTSEQVDAAWSKYLKNMSDEGTWGGDIEITAFAGAFDTNVKIWRPYDESPYILRCPNDPGEKQIVHIAFHSWQHYSSVRNVSGPHQGLPQIWGQDFSAEERASLKAQSTSLNKVKEWMITTVQNSVPRFIDNDTAKRALLDANCDVDDAVSKLLLDMSDGSSSTSSNPGSSGSTEREPDSDDEGSNGPNKRRDRRMSRATKAMRKAQDKASSDDSAGLDPTEPLSNGEEGSPTPDISNRVIKRPIAKKSRRKIVRDVDDDIDQACRTISPLGDNGSFKAAKDDDIISEYSTTSHSQSRASTPAAPPLKITFKVTSSKLAAAKAEEAQQKRRPAREQQAIKKASQKAARKEGKRASAQAPQEVDNPGQNHLGQGMKALFI